MAEPLESLLARTFDGRVVPHRDDPHNRYSDFTGDPLVLYPWSDAGLGHAVQLKEQLGANGFLRSGLSSSGDGPVETGGGVVVDLTGFTRIEVRGNSIEVEAGATTRQLADALVQTSSCHWATTRSRASSRASSRTGRAASTAARAGSATTSRRSRWSPRRAS